MRVIVCGGDYSMEGLQEHVNEKLDKLHSRHVLELVITGDELGAGGCAAEWAGLNEVEFEKVRPELKGKIALYNKRNAKMLDMNPDLIIVYPKGRGINALVHKSVEMGVTIEFELEAGKAFFGDIASIN